MLKTVLPYVSVLNDTDEVRAIGYLGGLFEAIKKSGAEVFLQQGKILRAAFTLHSIFQTKQFSGLINPKAKELLSLRHIGNLKLNVGRLLEAAKALSDLDADDKQILLRVGLIDMNRVGDFIGRIGSFYAARGPSDQAAWAVFFKECASETSGTEWTEIAQTKMSSGFSCGDFFIKTLTEYRTRLIAREPIADGREKDLIGAHFPVLNSSSIIQGSDIVTQYAAGLKDYAQGRPFDFLPGFENVKIGYWGAPGDLAKIAQNKMHYSDEKTLRFVPLGQTQWKETMVHSASEPGLNQILKLNDSTLTGGGWMDASAVLVLKNLGCDKVIYVTRASGESTFITGVARMLGMDDQVNQSLFASKLDSNGRPSAFRLSSTEANGVWCTNWNAKSFPDVAGLFGDGYHAQFITDDAGFRQRASAHELLSPLSMPNPEPIELQECSFR